MVTFAYQFIIMDFESIFTTYKVPELHGRYITLDHIQPLLQKWNQNNELSIIGQSVEDRPIYQFQTGTGKTRILMWSQMHGNESTTTKALFDFLNFLHSRNGIANNLLKEFTFCCLPMVNPDGAKLYTRENAVKVDLNRDANLLTQPESKALRLAFDNFKPHFCYNLHDQRTIYGAGTSGKPATISFLAPSYNEAREINAHRAKAIDIIAAMNIELQKIIPGQIGRFDDSFNINCIGDTFQSLNVPTVLFEAGHFPNDYEREETRKLIFIALLSGFEFINENVVVSNGLDEYLNIPQNKVNFYDLVYKNVKINYDCNKIITNFAAQYTEELVEETIQFCANIVQIDNLEDFFGHVEFDAEGAEFQNENVNFPEIGQKADFNFNNNVKVVNGIVKN